MSRALLAMLLVLAIPACRAQLGAVTECGQPFAFQSFTVESAILGEARRINVYTPPNYATDAGARFPILYMPDGGIEEDFLHVADAIHSGVIYEILRPVIVVGIENTVRRRDLAPATAIEEERKAAPQAGGTSKFRAFLRDELMPLIRERYRAAEETAIVGESLAGLFVVETFLHEPQLFDAYIAISPSLQWNAFAVLSDAGARLKPIGAMKKKLYLTSANEEDIVRGVQTLAKKLSAAGVEFIYHPMPDEFHDTIYRASSPRAFRMIFARGP